MASEAKMYLITTRPGIKRDGTTLDGDFYSDGEWVRFQRGKPRKIGGFRQISNTLTGIVYGCNTATQNNLLYVHCGSANNLEQLQVTLQSPLGGTLVDRTPVSFVNNPNNMWQFDQIWDAGGSDVTLLVAHAAPNLSVIDSDTEAAVYSGDVFDTAVLTEIDLSAITTSGFSGVSGGVCALHPYLTVFGSNGFFAWSVENTPTDFTGVGSGQANVTAGKILKGFQVKAGTGNTPAGLYFATDSLIKVNFIGGDAVFNFDLVASGYSILSANSVVEYDGIYYWIGIDRFLVYNGQIREVPNEMNLNFFFDNLNYDQRQKVWGVRVPRYGEIWWHFPYGDSEECNHVIILNVREGTWYDTPLDGRSSGAPASVFQYPIAFDTNLSETGMVRLWQHEYGVDKVEGGSILAIKSSFTTSNLSFAVEGIVGQEPVGIDRNIYIERLEPDFILEGSLAFQIFGRAYAQNDLNESEIFTIDSDTPYINARAEYREMYFQFTSNEAGGDYQAGLNIIKASIGSGRPAQTTG